MTTDVREQVRERYAEAALSLAEDAAAAATARASAAAARRRRRCFGQGLYAPTSEPSLPENAVAASLGCGNPVAVAEMHEGETVLDLGSGGGIDVLLSARRVGPTGTVYGLDMTDEMLALAQRERARRRA